MLPVIFLGLFVSLAVLRALHQRRPLQTNGIPSAHVHLEGRRLDSIRRLLTALLSLAVIIFGFHHVFGLFSWFASFSLPFPSWIRWLGSLGALASLAMLHQVHCDLGEAFSVQLLVRENHPLVTNGWYARIRHPMYSALCAFFVSSSLVAANLLILAPAVALAAVLCSRTDVEERMMEAHFGDAYRRYRAHTGRLLPKLTRQTQKG